MAVRVLAAFGLIATLAGCGGNPWIHSESDGETVTADGVVNGVTINSKVQGNMNAVTYATGINPITVNMTSQDSAALNGQYARNPQFDVAGYKAYTHQQSTSNRYVVVLVADTLSSAKAMIAMDAGQFSNSHAGGLYSRSEAFVKPVTTLGGGAQPTFNYSGTYAGLLNWGAPTPGGPGGILNPTRAYRTSGEVLITADFIEMNISGGIQNRKVVDTGTLLPDIAFKETSIDSAGNFVGVIERLDSEWTTAGDYAGIIAGPNGSQIATLLRFQPIQEESALYEQGIFVSASCTEAIPTGPACSQ
jgi:hypothetical protein